MQNLQRPVLSRERERDPLVYKKVEFSFQTLKMGARSHVRDSFLNISSKLE